MTQTRNLAHLLGIGTDPALSRLLRACGVDEACVTGRASDYDHFLALAAALPLCEGHPLRDAVHVKLTAATGLSAPLCPHTAKAYWDTWVERYWYGGDVPTPSLPALCPFCAPCKPSVRRREEMVALPDPLLVLGKNLGEWSLALEALLPDDGRAALVTLPEAYEFLRPNPYHANLAVEKIHRGEEMTEGEKNLLWAQALRVWGQAALHRGSTLLWRGGDPRGVLSLLGYLDASRALPPTVWIPRRPADAGAVSGLYPTLRTGMSLPVGEDARREYAAAAPLGNCVFVEETELV